MHQDDETGEQAEKGEPVLGPDLPISLNAVLAPTFEGGHGEAFVDGYRSAAIHLNQAALNIASGLIPDEVVYPILHLWRHYLEVRLKTLVALMGGTPPIGHSLAAVWSVMLDRLGQERGREAWIGEVASAVASFEDADPTSQAFRYHEGTKGQPLLDPNKLVNLGRLFSRMQGIADHLDGLVDEIIEGRRM